MSNPYALGPSGAEVQTEVQALRGTVENLTHQLMLRDIAEAVRLKAEADAKLPPPEPFEVKTKRSFCESECLHFMEDYRQRAWSEKFNYGTSTPFPLAAGWPDNINPVAFVRRCNGLNAEGTALIGSEEPIKTEPAPSFMDKWMNK